MPNLEREWTTWDPRSLQFNDIHIYIEAQLTDTLYPKGNALNLGGVWSCQAARGRPRAPAKLKKKTNKRKTKRNTKKNTKKNTKEKQKGRKHKGEGNTKGRKHKGGRGNKKG